MSRNGTWRLTGTPGYIAPEVYEAMLGNSDLNAQPSMDLYSFGALTWRLFTGNKPPGRQIANWQDRVQDQQRLWQQIDTTAPRDDVLSGFVKALTRQEPSSRLSHDGVASHEFWSGLQERLPTFENDIAGVEDWIQRLQKRRAGVPRRDTNISSN